MTDLPQGSTKTLSKSRHVVFGYFLERREWKFSSCTRLAAKYVRSCDIHVTDIITYILFLYANIKVAYTHKNYLINVSVKIYS